MEGLEFESRPYTSVNVSVWLIIKYLLGPGDGCGAVDRSALTLAARLYYLL